MVCNPDSLRNDNPENSASLRLTASQDVPLLQPGDIRPDRGKNAPPGNKPPKPGTDFNGTWGHRPSQAATEPAIEADRGGPRGKARTLATVTGLISALMPEDMTGTVEIAPVQALLFTKGKAHATHLWHVLKSRAAELRLATEDLKMSLQVLPCRYAVKLHVVNPKTTELVYIGLVRIITPSQLRAYPDDMLLAMDHVCAARHFTPPYVEE